MQRLDPNRVPKHIAIIMDGNGRWAQQKGLTRTEGHRKGLEAAQRVVEACEELGVRILTLYAFSKENWRRPRKEVDDLMGMMQRALRRERDRLLQRNIRLNVIGDLEDLPRGVRDLLIDTMEMTKGKGGMVVNLALSYGGRAEILTAVKGIVADIEAGNIHGAEITEELFSRYLYTRDMPDPDLLIRTSGEQRISNFLLWQLAYTELYFTPILWPDFGKEELLQACLAYQQRERRFGLTTEQIRGGTADR